MTRCAAVIGLFLTLPVKGEAISYTFTKIADNNPSSEFAAFQDHPTINSAGTVVFHGAKNTGASGIYSGSGRSITTIADNLSTAAADPGISTALRSVGLLDVLSSTPAVPSVARLVSTPVCAASLRNLVRNAG